MFDHRLNSCAVLATGKCPHQANMERAYLVPQLLSPLQLLSFQGTCLDCNYFHDRQCILLLPALSNQVRSMTGSSCL
jgi:hypothetical protein